MTTHRQAVVARRKRMKKGGRNINKFDGTQRLIYARLQRKFAAEGRIFKKKEVTEADVRSVMRVNGGRIWDKDQKKKKRRNNERKR